MVRFCRSSLAVICLAFLPGLFAARAQTRQLPSQQNVSTSVSLTHLYWHMLMWQNHLDQTAADHERSGRDGTWLRTYLQRRLGFNDAEFKPVRQSAQHLQVTIAGLDAQAKAVVKQQRILYGEGLLSASDPPSDLPELRELSQQREVAINRQITQMNAALGPVNSERLKFFVERVFARNVRVFTPQTQLNMPKDMGLGAAHQGVQP